MNYTKKHFINVEKWTDFPVAIFRLGPFSFENQPKISKEDYSFDVITVQYHKPVGIEFSFFCFPLPLALSFSFHFILINFISCSRDDWKANKTFDFHFVQILFFLLRFMSDQQQQRKMYRLFPNLCVTIHMQKAESICGIVSTWYDRPWRLFSVSFMDQLKRSQQKKRRQKRYLIL